MNIFQFNFYREALRSAVLEKKTSHGNAYTFAKMAKACKIQNTYLSTVLKGEHHLNSDQLYAAAMYLGFSDEEYRFLNLLHEHERSTLPQRKKYLEQEIKRERQQGLKTESYIKGTHSSADKPLLNYQLYLNAHAPLVHMFLTIKRFRSKPELVRQMLGLDSSTFEEALQSCANAGLIKISKSGLEILIDSIHLPASSPLFPVYRSHLRQKADEFMLSRDKSKYYSFVALYSASEDTRSIIHSRFLDFLNWVQTITQKTEPTQVYQMAFDLLCWSEE